VAGPRADALVVARCVLCRRSQRAMNARLSAGGIEGYRAPGAVGLRPPPLGGGRRRGLRGRPTAGQGSKRRPRCAWLTGGVGTPRPLRNIKQQQRRRRGVASGANPDWLGSAARTSLLAAQLPSRLNIQGALQAHEAANGPPFGGGRRRGNGGGRGEYGASTPRPAARGERAGDWGGGRAGFKVSTIREGPAERGPRGRQAGWEA
jgi:hypothetical protein